MSSSYGTILYTDVLNRLKGTGWKIVAQSTDSITIEKQVGAPGWAVIPLALVPVFGALLGALWVYLAGKATVKIERHLTKARVVAPKVAFDVNREEDFEDFLAQYRFRGHVHYMPILVVGGVTTFLLMLLFSFSVA